MKKRAIIFGVGKIFSFFMKIYDKEKIDIIALCDNNSALIGTKMIENKIISPAEISSYNYDYIIITSTYYIEIKQQLKKLGVEENLILDFSFIGRTFELDINNQITEIVKDDIILSLKKKEDKSEIQEIKELQEKNLFLSANIFVNANKDRRIKSLEEVEFKVFSQFGEDGIIQWLIHNMEIPNKIFVEFGVEDYSEANTRFLLMNDNWTGLVIDGSKENIDKVKRWESYWKYDLLAKAAFITKENINDLMKDSGITGDIGILSVDIDGNDYWVLDNITCICPRVLICEYNNIFGPDEKISVPYDKEFVRSKKHFSQLYWGASLKAYVDWAEEHNYYYVGSNRAGNNAFFVRKDCFDKNKLPESLEYRESKFRESRDEKGNLSFLRGKERLEQIKEMEVVNLEKESIESIGSIFFQ